MLGSSPPGSSPTTAIAPNVGVVHAVPLVRPRERLLLARPASGCAARLPRLVGLLQLDGLVVGHRPVAYLRRPCACKDQAFLQPFVLSPHLASPLERVADQAGEHRRSRSRRRRLDRGDRRPAEGCQRAVQLRHQPLLHALLSLTVARANPASSSSDSATAAPVVSIASMLSAMSFVFGL